MTLRKKILAVIGLTFLIGVAFFYGITSRIIFGSFLDLEEQNTETNVRRALDALAKDIEGLESTGADWAAWNETRDFVMNGNREYIENNLCPVTFTNLRVHFMVFINTSGQLVHAVGANLADEGKIKPVSMDLITHVLTQKTLFEHTGPQDSKTGLVLLPEDPIIISSWPISCNEMEGPVNGTFVIGRYFDKDAIKALGDRTHLSVTFQRMDRTEIPEDFEDARRFLSNGNQTAVRPVSADVIAGYAIQRDIHGKPCLILRVDLPRKIWKHGRASTRHFMGVFLIVGFLVLLVLVIILQTTVLGPVSSLTRHVLAIGQSGDLSVRTRFRSRDEIGILAREFDGMLEKLSEARNRLLEQSYYSGSAEMASGILHNVRNRLTPVVVQIDVLTEKVRSAPLNNVERAVAELSGRDLDRERETALNRYLQIGSGHMLTLLKYTDHQLQEISQQVAYIEEILSQQEKFTHPDRVVEPLRIQDTMEEAAMLMPRDLCSAVSIDILPEIAQLPAVSAERIVLIQVFTNLLNNAAESILRKGSPPPGTIGISGEVEGQDGPRMVHLRVRDNGDGIHEDSLKSIFAGGFSRKKSPLSGIGLHWCGNVLSAMNGMLYAESDGIGQGACFHVKIPLHET